MKSTLDPNDPFVNHVSGKLLKEKVPIDDSFEGFKEK